MKQFRRALLLMMTAVLVICLCSCSNMKVKPEKINTKDYSRTIRLAEVVGSSEIVHSSKSSEAVKEGTVLQSTDTVRVGAGAQLSLNADSDKHILAEENTGFRLEASGSPESGKTRLVLEKGGLTAALDRKLADGELFEIQTKGGTVSARNGLFRVSVFTDNGVEYTLAEVLEGEAELVINITGDTAAARAGEAVMIENPAQSNPEFVLADEIDDSFWKSSDFTGMKVGQNGTGAKTMPIPYSKLPAAVLEKLAAYAEGGRSLPLSAQAFRNLLETGHDYQETPVREAACTEEGLIALECSLCGGTSEKTIPALGHVEQTIEGVEPDCVNTGLTEGVKCSVCDEILTEQEEIPALGHSIEVLPAVEADYEKEGLTEGAQCAVCGEILVAQKVIPALGYSSQITEEGDAAAEHTEHREMVAAGFVPTCEAEGRTDGIVCADCGLVLKEQEIIPALGHTEMVVHGFAPACESTGLTDGVRCAVCDQWLAEQETISALPHEFVVTPGEAATCTSAGYTASEACVLCGKVATASQVIPATGHSPVRLPGREATCISPGLTEGQRCSTCNQLLVERKMIPALPHTPRTVAAVAPTCTKTGLEEGSKCGVCGRILVAQKLVPALGHTAAVLPYVEATCTQTGLTEGSMCTVCGEILIAQEVIPMLPHIEKAIPAVETTCSASGLTEGSICTVCGTITIPQKVIPALPHTPEKIRGKATACYRDGWTEGSKCSVCGEILIPCEVIPAIPHTEGWLSPIDPTCTSVGWTYGHACEICGEITLPQTMIPRLPHSLISPIREYNEADHVFTSTGELLCDDTHPTYCYIEVGTCSLCGEMIHEVVPHVSDAPIHTELGDGTTLTTIDCAVCMKEIFHLVH